MASRCRGALAPWPNPRAIINSPQWRAIATAAFLDDVHDLGVPVIIGSCRLAKVLEQAGDTVLVMADIHCLAELEAANRTPPA